MAMDRAEFDPIKEDLDRLTIPLEAACEQSEILLNFHYALDQPAVSRFKKAALVDIDPGLLQLWIAQGHISPARYDLYFTIGETVGTDEALFPDCGLRWLYTPPPVSLTEWHPVAAPPRAPYTTVSGWWGQWLEIEGELFENSKRTSFLPYLDLPARASAAFELALCLPADNNPVEDLLRQNGWGVNQAREMSYEQYRDFVYRSRGEFSCAKPSCMKLQNAWISDRTLCYLASGKPAIVQHTGPSRFLPEAQGLLRFRTPEEAVRLLAESESNYPRHCRDARALAETYFDARKVVTGVLDKALA
jgi:hypothetical protein